MVVDTSRAWALAMLEVDMAASLPADSTAIRAFLEGDLPQPLPTLPTLMTKLMNDGATAHVATAYLKACGTAQELASAVGYVSASRGVYPAVFC